MRNLQIGKPEKKILSGGQRKRVNIALELVTDPVILFLDEPTSGLAADDTTALITLLSDLAKKTGKTIIMTIHQPAKDEFEKFNLVLIMGYGGVPMFFGPTQARRIPVLRLVERTQRARAPSTTRATCSTCSTSASGPSSRRFARRTPRRRAAKPDSIAAKEWNKEFFNNGNPMFQKMYSGKRAVGTEPTTRGVPHRSSTTSGQLGLLLSRYFKVKMRDVGGTVIMLAAGADHRRCCWPSCSVARRRPFPIGASARCKSCSARRGLGEPSKRSPRGDEADHRPHGGDLLPRGGRRVVRHLERGARDRERARDLPARAHGQPRHLQLRVLEVHSARALLRHSVHAALGIVFFALGFNGGPPAFLLELGVMVVTSLNAVAIGLTLSTVVSSSEAAMALTPIALIPQVVLGGLMVPMTTNPLLKWLMLVIPARWGFQGVVAQERMAIGSDPAWVIDLKNPTLTSVEDFLTAGRFKCATAQIASDTLNGAWGFTNFDVLWIPHAVLGGITFVTLVFMLLVLKRRDPV